MSALGPTLALTRSVAPDGTARAVLSPGTRGQSAADGIVWDLTATAPPEGRRVSGC